ncbi:hypothetical protein [Streptomyces sp. NRRL S-1824]|nr:hypothetical protein [Streptomyces sp. NRRL S-1824]
MDTRALRGGQHLVLGDELTVVGRVPDWHPVRLPKSGEFDAVLVA